LELINFGRGRHYYQIFYDGAPVPATDAGVCSRFPYSMAPSSSSSSNGDHGAFVVTNGTDTAPTLERFAPYESNLTFEQKRGQQHQQQHQQQQQQKVVFVKAVRACRSACDDACHRGPVRGHVTYSGSFGDGGSFGGRIQEDGDDDGGGGKDHPPRVLMGVRKRNCSGAEAEKEGSSSPCGEERRPYRVQVRRACLLKSSPTASCRRFVVGHPHVVPAEGPGPFEDDGP
jgi:hypothetical protein